MKKLGDIARRFKQKILSESLPAEKIAGGWAVGVFFGLFIPMGLQLIVLCPFMFLWPLKSLSKVGMTTGTFVTNPVTFLVFYPVQTYIANHIFFSGSLTLERLRAIDWENWRELGSEILYSYVVGGLMFALIASPIVYYAVKGLVLRHRGRK